MFDMRSIFRCINVNGYSILMFSSFVAHESVIWWREARLRMQNSRWVCLYGHGNDIKRVQWSRFVWAFWLSYFSPFFFFKYAVHTTDAELMTHFEIEIIVYEYTGKIKSNSRSMLDLQYISCVCVFDCKMTSANSPNVRPHSNCYMHTIRNYKRVYWGCTLREWVKVIYYSNSTIIEIKLKLLAISAWWTSQWLLFEKVHRCHLQISNYI